MLFSKLHSLLNDFTGNTPTLTETNQLILFIFNGLQNKDIPFYSYELGMLVQKTRVRQIDSSIVKRIQQLETLLVQLPDPNIQYSSPYSHFSVVSSSVYMTTRFTVKEHFSMPFSKFPSKQHSATWSCSCWNIQMKMHPFRFCCNK